jgi:hypothetical protein
MILEFHAFEIQVRGTDIGVWTIIGAPSFGSEANTQEQSTLSSTHA